MTFLKKMRGMEKAGLGRSMAGLALCLWLLQGCAATGGKADKPKAVEPKAEQTQPAATKDEKGESVSLTKPMKTPEDSLILDLLAGYRMLMVKIPDAHGLDPATLKKSRQAYESLDALLEQGGIKIQSAGKAGTPATGELRSSLQEALQMALQAAEKNAREGEWDKARLRWNEIVQSKPAMAFAMEEAQWGMVLSDALHSSLPDSLKKRLKAVYEGYADEISYELVGNQVRALLEDIKDIKLHRELKKLANRAWERDKQAGKITSPQVVQTEDPENAKAPGDSSKSHPDSVALAQAPGNPDVNAQPSLPLEATVLGAKADTLVLQGKYLSAFQILENAGDQAWVKEKKEQIGNRFCDEKRKSAVNSFKEFKKAPVDSIKRIHLNHTAADLDSCLFYFPGLSISQKVRKNREMVETELKKLKP